MNSNKRIKEYKIGSDPEMFLQDKVSKAIVSAIPFIPGSKDEPYQIPGLPAGCCIQTDNVMVEYCVPASTTAGELYEYLQMCKAYTNSIIPSNLEVVVLSSAHLDQQYLQDPKALKFGCDPDYNVWDDGMPNEAPLAGGDLRTAGGHVHIGYNDPDMSTSMDIVKAMDIFLGIPSVIMDLDRERKKMYGKAGAYRYKSYGLEYRSLSNFWLKDLESVQFVFKAVEAMVNFINEDKLSQVNDELQLKIQTCINTGDEKLAYELISQLQLDTVLKKSAIFID